MMMMMILVCFNLSNVCCLLSFVYDMHHASFSHWSFSFYTFKLATGRPTPLDKSWFIIILTGLAPKLECCEQHRCYHLIYS